MRAIYIVCVIALLGAMMMVTPASATTWHVYEGESIQAALDNASDGDTVFVHAGTYVLTEPQEWQICVNTPNITLKGEGADKVTLDGSGKGLIYVGPTGYGFSGAAPCCIVEGFRIINSKLGVNILDNSPNCIIRNNVIHALSSAVATIALNTTIVDNVMDGGEAIRFTLDVGITFENNIVSNMTKYGVFIGSMANSVRIVNNTFINNGAGIAICKVGTNEIIKNNISSNTKGIWLYKVSSGNKIYLNNFVDNTEGNVVATNTTTTQIWNSTEQIEYVYGGKTYTNYLGNYWSDYTGDDASPEDGIGDTPYDIAGINNDNHSLVAGFENYFEEAAPISSTPFLISGEVSYDNGNPVQNPTVTIGNLDTFDEFTVKTAASSNYYLAFTDSTHVSAGDTIRISVSDGVVFNETYHTVTASEMNEGGFMLDLTHVRPNPDFIITKISLKTAGYANEDNILGATVKNLGSANAGSFNVSLEVDGTLLGAQTVSSLGAGACTELEFAWTPAEPGSHMLSATADVNSGVEEWDETNNDLARTSVIIKRTDWPQFHYDEVHVGFSPSKAPNTNNMLWISDDIGAVAGSSTVIADDRVFVYGDSTGGAGGEHQLYCFNELTGGLIWNVSIPTPTWGSWSSPAYHDGKVFTSTGTETRCYNATGGEVIWVFVNPTNEASTNGGPVIADGKVVCSDWQAGHYFCLDEETGELLWTFTEEQTGSWGVGYAQGVAAYEDGNFYLTTWLYIGGNIYCVDADTGAEIWNQTTPLDTCGSPAVVDGTVYVTNYNFYGDGKIYAMDATDGEILWNHTIQRTDSTPAVAYGNVYVTGGCKGCSPRQTYCFNATTGDVIWSTDTADEIGCWTCSVAVADSKVFVGKSGSWFGYAGTYALDAFTGEIIWSYPEGGSSPAVANGTVFTIGGGKIYAFGGSEIPTGVTFDLKKLDLNSSGILKAFITLPEGYDVADINVSTVECEGAHAFGDGSVIPGKQALEVKFKIPDMADVPIGDAVLLSVTGELTTGERFEGSDTVEVIAK